MTGSITKRQKYGLLTTIVKNSFFLTENTPPRRNVGCAPIMEFIRPKPSIGCPGSTGMAYFSPQITFTHTPKPT
ncbi:MAG: hypothetical protein D6714_04040 [Bacteroidetes bacterium]|nr:MAG: hypothetical protein D6714_04040 [Bacteroidota bacterium]